MDTADEASGQQLPPLLRLPQHVRRMIYDELGLLNESDWTQINTDPWAMPLRMKWSSKRQKLKRRSRAISNQLFYVSRAISVDARQAWYSGNRWSFRGFIGLDILQNLTAVAMASLRALKLNFTFRRCPWGVFVYGPDFPPWELDYEALCGEHDWMLCENQRIEQWQRFCAQLSAHLPPDQLELELELKFDSVEYDGPHFPQLRERLEAVLNPFLEISRLRDLKVSILGAPTRSLPVHQFVEAILRQATGRVGKRSPPFRFGELPQEIQIQILKFTDLLSPEELTFNPKLGWTQVICQSRRCTESAPCPVNTASFWMGHWTMAVSLFEASRAIRKLSQLVFFSYNRFLFRLNEYDKLVTRCADNQPWRPEKSPFLQHIPRDCIRYVKHLTLVFPFIENLRPPKRPAKLEFASHRPETVEWRNTLQFISKEIPLNNLTLTVDLSIEHSIYGILRRAHPANRATDPRRWALYQRIIESLIIEFGGKKELRDLFVHVAWPKHEDFVELQRQHECELERRVMGDNYDSTARGKRETSERAWRLL